MQIIGYIGLVIFIICSVLIVILIFDFIYYCIAGSSWVHSWVPSVPYTKLVSEAILFTGPILHEKKIKSYPRYRISYYKHKKFAGVFNGEVVVYLKCNPDVTTLVNTVLHEVMHYIQYQTDKKYYKYNDYTTSLGYYQNPFEIESRAFADKYCNSCLEHLASKKLIVRK